jgi:hypothetical protein
MSRLALSRRGSASRSFGPLTFLQAGYGSNAEELGKIAAELRQIENEERGDSVDVFKDQPQKGR